MRRSLAATAVLAAMVVWASACGGSSSGPEPRPPSGSPIEQGEYSYATTGFERLRAAFSTAHRYPRTSTVTVEDTACGYTERWQPRPERMTEWRFCTSGRRWRLASLYDYHEFFGQAVVQRFTCRGPPVPRPPTVRLGFRWTDRCTGAGSRVTVRYVAARETVLRVGGEKVKTVLIRARARLSGRIDGRNANNSWLSRSEGLLVRRTVRSDTAIRSPFGKLADGERYRLELRSPTPR